MYGVCDAIKGIDKDSLVVRDDDRGRCNFLKDFFQSELRLRELRDAHNHMIYSHCC